MIDGEKPQDFKKRKRLLDIDQSEDLE